VPCDKRPPAAISNAKGTCFMARTRPQCRLTLGVSVAVAGASARAWNWPGTKRNRFADWEHYKRSAEIARSGVLDAIFVSDHPVLQRDVGRGPSTADRGRP
jgi:hypothetical protein